MNDKTTEEDFPVGLLIERNWISQSGQQVSPTEYYVLLKTLSDGGFSALDLVKQDIFRIYTSAVLFEVKTKTEIYQPTLIWPDGWESKERQESFLCEMKKKVFVSW